MVRAFTGLLLSIAFASGVMLAQTDRGTLRGNVQDSNGLVVPKAQVTIQEAETNVDARKLATDDDGNYEAPGLKPGRYRVKIEAEGFKRFQAENVQLDPGLARRIDVVLQVGATTDVVTLPSGPAVIRTENNTITDSFDRTRYLDRPQVETYPSPVPLMTTLSGVQATTSTVDIGGVTDRAKQTWAMDGVPNDTTGEQLANPMFFETVQVTQSGGGAEWSRPTGLDMISKRGANGLHGGVYYKHENSAFNANEFWANKAGIKKTAYIFHDAAADLGGSIIKNRTFFYAGWDHQSIPLGSFMTRTTPTVKMRNGDFSQVTAVVKDPFNNNAPFPNQKIPSTRINAVSQAIMDAYLPTPNLGAASTTTNNYGFVFPYSSDYFQGDWPFVRIDHKLTEKNTLYARWMRRLTPYIRAGSGYDWSLYTEKRDHQQIVVSDTHVFTPSLVNVFTFGRQTDVFDTGEAEKGKTPLYGDDVAKAVGLQGVNPGNYHTMGFPRMTITNIGTLYNSDGALDNRLSDDGTNTFSDILTWSRGRHQIKAGGEYRRFKWYSGALPAGTYGDFNFNGSIAGNAFAEFLLGVPYTSKRLSPLTSRTTHDTQAGFFLSDSFKATPRLTFDLGIRWDYLGIATYDDGLAYNFDITDGNIVVPAAARSKVNALYPSNIPIKTGQVIPKADNRNISLRGSFAFRLGANTVLRGGYAQFADSLSYLARRSASDVYQLTETYYNTVSSSGPLFSFPNPFPSSTASATVPNQDVTYFPLEPRTGTIRQFNATLEHDFGGTSFRFSYVGMRDGKLAFGPYNMNKPREGTATFSQSSRPFNLFNNIYVYGDSGAVHYNAVEMQVQKRAGAFLINSNLTWSKDLYNWANTENPYNLTNDWARDANNRKLYWATSISWDLPIGKGRYFLGGAPAPVNAVLGGWRAQIINTMATPTWASPAFSGADPSGTGTIGGLPDMVKNPYNSDYTRTIYKWFDPTAFRVPKKGNFGNASPNSLEVYGLNVQHLSLAKTFRITERVRTTFTAAGSNVLNHPHFSGLNTNISNPKPGWFTTTSSTSDPEKTSYRQIDLRLRIEW